MEKVTVSINPIPRNAISNNVFEIFLERTIHAEELVLQDDTFYNTFKTILEHFKNRPPATLNYPHNNLELYRARKAPIYPRPGCRSNNSEDFEKYDIGRIKNTRQVDGRAFFIPEKNGNPLTHELGCNLPENTNQARWNFNNEPVLYLAETPTTAITEIQPKVERDIWVSEWKVKNESVLLDLYNETVWLSHLENNPSREAIPDTNISTAFYTKFFEGFNRIISIPSPDDTASRQRHYRPTQFLARLISECGYDGFVYKSSLTGEKCFVIFNQETCQYQDYDVYRVHSETSSLSFTLNYRLIPRAEWDAC